MFNRVAGFTIIEVMTVLAISGVMLIGAVSLVQTQNVRSQFSQSISDLDSKLNKYITDLHSAVDETAEAFKCTGYNPAIGNLNTRPIVASGSNGVGGNGDCLFLGKAFQVNPGASGGNDNNVYVYTVVGNRLMAGAGGTIVPADSFHDSNPEPAFSLNDSFAIPLSLRVTKSSFAGSSYGGSSQPASNMAGFYNSLDSTGAIQEFKNYAFSNSGTQDTSLSDTGVKACLEELGACGNSTFSRWDLCLQYSNITAQLSVIPTSAGIRTEVKYISC